MKFVSSDTVFKSMRTPLKNQTIHAKINHVPVENAMIFTIKKIGQGIKEGSKYLPIRNFAAAAAWKAPRKDYLGQLKEIWNAFVKRWRYVKDPDRVELLQSGPKAIAQLTIGLFGGVDGRGRGVGDCDDCAMAIGAMAKAIGFNVRICTTAKKGFPMSHVFVQCQVPKMGWVTVDPVILPNKSFGQMPDFYAMNIYDLDGQQIGRVIKRRSVAIPAASQQRRI